MKKIKMSDILLTVCAIAIVCGIGSLTLRGKKTTEKLIIGDWYQQWSDSLTFSIYDDGTVNVPSSTPQKAHKRYELRATIKNFRKVKKC